jgi:hypothetical protein
MPVLITTVNAIFYISTRTDRQRKSSKVAKKNYNYANSFDIMKYQQQDQTNKQMVKYCIY